MLTFSFPVTPFPEVKLVVQSSKRMKCDFSGSHYQHKLSVKVLGPGYSKSLITQAIPGTQRPAFWSSSGTSQRNLFNRSIVTAWPGELTVLCMTKRLHIFLWFLPSLPENLYSTLFYVFKLYVSLLKSYDYNPWSVLLRGEYIEK